MFFKDKTEKGKRIHKVLETMRNISYEYCIILKCIIELTQQFSHASTQTLSILKQLTTQNSCTIIQKQQ